MRCMLRLLVILAVPIVLTMTIVRALTFPWYARFEYARTSFPTDPFGMPPEERLRLAETTIRYLNLPGRPTMLEHLRFADGEPAYNERELGHMEDVKAVFDGLTLLAGVALAVSLASVWFLVRLDRCAPWSALAQGGALTLALLLGLATWMLIGFEGFFQAFHGVFFASGTWVFSYSDTLIRLFPLPFWQDAGLLVAGGVCVLAACAVAVGVWRVRCCVAGRGTSQN